MDVALGSCSFVFLIAVFVFILACIDEVSTHYQSDLGNLQNMARIDTPSLLFGTAGSLSHNVASYALVFVARSLFGAVGGVVFSFPLGVARNAAVFGDCVSMVVTSMRAVGFIVASTSIDCLRAQVTLHESKKKSYELQATAPTTPPPTQRDDNDDDVNDDIITQLLDNDDDLDAIEELLTHMQINQRHDDQDASLSSSSLSSSSDMDDGNRLRDAPKVRLRNDFDFADAVNSCRHCQRTSNPCIVD